MTDNYIEDFKYLLEIQSLEMHWKRHLDAQTAHLQRLVQIDQQIELRRKRYEATQAELKKLKQELQGHEVNLQKIQQRIDQNRRNASSLQTQSQLDSSETERLNLSAQRETLESTLLELMEQIESKEKEFHLDQEFLQGSTKTRTHVEAEVKTDHQMEAVEIQRLQVRIQSLKDHLQIQVRRKFEMLEDKFRFKFLAELEDDTCRRCNTKINRNLYHNIESGRIIENCPGCGRMLIPEKARTSL